MTEEIGYEIICEIYPVLQPEPYLGEVEKHGTHDQKTHGNWAGGSSPTANIYASFSEKEIMGVADYIQDGYYSTNKWLRQGDSLPPGDRKTLERSQPKKVEVLDAVFQKIAPSENELQVYRGVSGELATKLVQAPVGSTFVDKGYVSTSGMIEIAQDFTTVGNPMAPTAVLSITVPTGTKVLQVPQFFPYIPRAAVELERILPRGTKFEITGKTIDGYMNDVIELKVVSSE